MHIPTRLRPSLPLALAALTLGAPSAAAQAVRIVDLPGAGPIPSLQAAIDLAPEGALLLVAPGDYADATIDGKSLSLVGTVGENPWDVPTISGTLVVRNLAAGQRVLVVGFDAWTDSGPALLLENDLGQVRLEDCHLDGGYAYDPDSGTNYAGAAGAVVVACSQAVFVRSEIHGGDAAWLPGWWPVTGGDGLRSVDSSVALFDCEVIGGRGSEETSPAGGDGGPGARVSGFGMIVSGGTLRGGGGGGGDYIGCTVGGAGGAGLSILNGQAQLVDALALGGGGGWGSCGVDGTPGDPIQATNSNVVQDPGPSRSLTAPRLSSDRRRVTLALEGQPGDRVSLFLGTAPAFAYAPLLHGLWTVQPGALGSQLAFGVVPPSGQLTLEFLAPDLPPGTAQRTAFLQALCRTPGGVGVLTSPAQTWVLDRDAQPDCDGNGTNDYVDLLELAPDCNLNLVLDSCDIAYGLEPDANGNGVPDSCD